MVVEEKDAAAARTQRTRGLTKVWHQRRPAPDTPSNAPLLERILAARGVGPGPATEPFLSPTLKDLHDPSLMPGLDRAAQRIWDAARTGGRTVIYGDYDVDGVSATAILYHALKAVAPDCNLATYVPHRLEEGYGLNATSIADLCRGAADAPPAKVIISVDCGITAVEPARVAREHAVDLIITDHHNPPAEGQPLPDAFALVHPRLPGSAYPFADLCGAGVAFKLAWRIMTLAQGSPRLDDRLRAVLLELLGLCSLGVVADVVPLVGENRVIARFGLSKIKHSTIEGLRALVEASGLSGENIRAEDVGFRLGPRLNACGRMGHAREAVELLTTARAQRARDIAEDLTRKNDERRRTEREIFDHACQLAEAAGMTTSDRRAIVLTHPEWHAGVVGIVCSRLVERYHRPAILLCEKHDDGRTLLHGSGRSVEGVNLHAAIHACAQHVEGYGGHDMAAGLRLRPEHLGAFRDAFNDTISRVLRPDDLIGRAPYDTHAHLHELTPRAVRSFDALAPFGRDNPTIVLRFPALRVAQRPTLIGSDAKHLSLHLQSRDGHMVRAVAWRWGERVRDIPHGGTLDVLATPKISEWGGNTRVELEVVDAALTP
jgi:single-stranded-DNA-specific exonuclease